MGNVARVLQILLNFSAEDVAKVDEQQLRVTESMRDVCQVRDAKRSLVHVYFLTAASLEAPD